MEETQDRLIIEKRISHLNQYLSEAETLIFPLDPIGGGEDIDEDVLRSDYELARKTMIELSEYVRKCDAQVDSDEETDERLAHKLAGMSEMQIKRVQKLVVGVKLNATS